MSIFDLHDIRVQCSSRSNLRLSHFRDRRRQAAAARLEDSSALWPQQLFSPTPEKVNKPLIEGPQKFLRGKPVFFLSHLHVPGAINHFG